MCRPSAEEREIEERRLCDLYRIPEEIRLKEPGTETLVLTMPDGHPLNKIPDIEQRISALETKLTQMDQKLDRIISMIDKVGQLAHASWRIIDGAQQAVQSQKIIVPGRS